MAGRPGRTGRKADIPHTVFRIPSGSSTGDPVPALARCKHTVELLSALPSITYANWKVELEVHVPRERVKLYQTELKGLPVRVYERPEFPTRGAMRFYLENLGNPGYLAMLDDDFRGLDRFPSLNAFDLVQDPDQIASILRLAFADMSNPAALRGEFTEATPPWIFGFRARECEDISRKQGSSGPRVALPNLGPLQPIIQNFVVIRKGAPGEYPIDLHHCEDAWRQASCEAVAGVGSIGTHMIAKIDFYRSGTNAKNKNDKAYQQDFKKFSSNFPFWRRIIRMRGSWTEEGRKRAASLQS